MSRLQNGARLTGKCKVCAQDVALVAGHWIHQGLGYGIHSAIVEAQRKAVARG